MNEHASPQLRPTTTAPLIAEFKSKGRVDLNLIPDHLLERFFEQVTWLQAAYPDDPERLHRAAFFNLGLSPGGGLHVVAPEFESPETGPLRSTAPVDRGHLRRTPRPRERRERRSSSRSSSRGGDSGDPDLADEAEPPSGRGAA